MRRLILPTAATLVALTATAALAAPPPPGSITLDPLGTYATGEFDESAAEIVAYDPDTQTLFVVNANAGRLDLLDISDPSTPTPIGSLASTVPGGSANSVAVANGIVAVAVAAATGTDNGVVELFDAAAIVADVTTPPAVVLQVGANPDMVTFTPDGTTLLVANEGEPNDDYTIDPVGSISVIAVRGIDDVGQSDVRTAGFEAFTAVEGVRVFGPGASFAQDVEPEYVAISEDGSTAYVALQENNAIAIVDIASATVTDVAPLGFKDHLLPGNELDATDKDGGIDIRSWPLLGMFQPDSIATYSAGGQNLVVTANEGDARDYDGFSEEARGEDVTLCEDAFSEFADSLGVTVADLSAEEYLGRINITTTLGERDGEGCYEQLYSYGARSFSIFTPTGELVYDSGNDFETIIAGLIADGELPAFAFNANNDENAQDVVDEDGGSLADVLATPSESRSDNKGVEPEAVTLGRIGDQTFAFVGLERIGGIMIYDVTDPAGSTFVDYVTTRDFGPNANSAAAGDLGPEGLAFITAADSPTGVPLLAVGNEVSGTTTIFEVVLPATLPDTGVGAAGLLGLGAGLTLLGGAGAFAARRREHA